VTPKRVGESLDRVTGSLGVSRSTTLQIVFSRWEELVGEVVAAHATPAALREGSLVVRVDDPAWATQLRWFQGDLLARLETAVGPGEVTAIEIRVAHS
jgi:predicted nucleic acid-binding Zn ribbon protein